jgi:hypothetical protein
MTGNALRARRWWLRVALIVTGLALRLGVAPSETQAGVVVPGIGDLAPVRFVVARGAFGIGKPALVRIFVARNAVGLQTQIRRIAAPVLAIVAIGALEGSMSTLERPTRLAVVEAVRRPSRPSDQLGISSQVLDVTTSTVLTSILSTVQTCLLPYSSAEVIVAAEAGIGVETLARGMAFAAFGIALEVGMRVAELARRQELCAGRPRCERPSHGGREHQ